MTRRQISIFGLASLAAARARAQRPEGPDAWFGVLKKRLPEYGHRNWIVIADSAYPLQSNPGIETIVSDAQYLHVLRITLDEIAKMPHVRPIVHTDKELEFVSDADAPGISAFRQRLAATLGNQQITAIPHEQVIHQLDEAARVFNVLIIKTSLTLPYTSVFLQLDCAYWSPDAEQRLRQAMTGK
jgi:hypothetical protein